MKLHHNTESKNCSHDSLNMDSNKYMKLCIFLCVLIVCGCKNKVAQVNKEQILWASEWDGELDEFLDKYKTFSYSDGRPYILAKEDFYALSEEEDSMAVKMLCSFFNKEDFSSYKQKPFSMREYFRQYIGYKHDGHIMVHVNIYTHIPYRKDPQCFSIYMEDITQTLINEEYGGVHYGTIILDLTEQKVKSFSLNQSQGHSITGTGLK